ncbi:MAG TPA: hypothetical protein PKA41_18650, partial [Verrucomicrobiota bacterium]|nr:hypothetical protein [Verrucomicrobiota bacterium]
MKPELRRMKSRRISEHFASIKAALLDRVVRPDRVPRISEFNPYCMVGLRFPVSRITRTAYLTALCAALVGSAAADNLQLVTVAAPALAPSASANGDSYAPVISADGRFVLFASEADNLVTNGAGQAFPLSAPPVLNVFLHDVLGGINRLVSVNTNGTAGGNGNSIPISISTNGQFVLFESRASNLTAKDTNNATDVFVRDLVNQTTTLVSVSTNGWSGTANPTPSPNSYKVTPHSQNPVMSPDGRMVAFASAADNLVAGDTNRLADVFLRDLQAGVTELISVGAVASNSFLFPERLRSDNPALSEDGRFVAFYSSATNLIGGETRAGEVYVRDRQTGVTTLASADALALFASVYAGSNAASCNPRLSASGDYVAFLTVTNPPTLTNAPAIILRHNLTTAQTDLIHTNAFAPYNFYATAFEMIGNLDMTPDGRFVTFVANTAGASGERTAVYLWDALTGTNTLVSVNTNNAAPAEGFCNWPSVSADGRFVVFLSTATDLVTNSVSAEYHVYLRDTAACTTRLLDVNLSRRGAGVDASAAPRLSADGSRITFESRASDLVTNDLNHASDVYLCDVTSDTTTLISARHPSLPSSTPNGFVAYSAQPLSDDGRYVVFSSRADNLISGDTNDMPDVFLRDLLTGSNLCVSVADDGPPGTGASVEAVIGGN